jgi:hypothetical protein
MNLQKPDDMLVEPWWVTVLGCLALATLFWILLIGT